MQTIAGRRMLYISYYGATEPLFWSQMLPYIEGLAQSGMQCRIITFEKREHTTPERRALVRERLAQSNIRWHPVRYHKRPSVPATLFDSAVGIIYGLMLSLRYRIDVIHARSTVPALMAYVLRCLIGTKFLYDMRGFIAEEYADGTRWKRASCRYRVVDNFERFLLHNADHRILLTERIKKELIDRERLTDHEALHSTIIPCCVNDTAFCPREKPVSLLERYRLIGKIILLYSGSVGGMYMLDEMFDFFITFRQHKPQAHFLILNQHDQILIRERALCKGIADAVTVDSVAPDMMPNYVALADWGIIFCRPGFSRLASSPTKVGEYLACGVPTVMSAGMGDYEKLLNDRALGVVISRFDEAGYKDAVTAMDVLDNDRQALSARCRAVAETTLSLANGRALYSTAYEQLLTGTG